MMSNRYNLSNISDINNKKIFFDANILIYLFWASGSSYFENKYAKIYTKLNNQKNIYIIDFVVISEVINRAIRLEHDKYRAENNINNISDYPFKKFRDSNDGQEALKDIYTIISSEILENFELIEKKYSKQFLKPLLVVDKLDFGDKIIVKICDENDYILLTNDKDFKDSNIDILTSNKKIFNNQQSKQHKYRR